MKPENNDNQQLLIDMIQVSCPQQRLDTLVQINKRTSHQHCMLCGPQAVLGLNLIFYHTGDQQVWAHAKGTIHQQGYLGIMHGGFLAALLDAAMCQAVFQQNIEAVTADMSIRYLHEVALNSDILITGTVIKSYPPLYKAEAELYVNGRLMVKSNARFMKKVSEAE
ncbi:PaaI family thioesterase [Psychromonas aquimarina]|uniref:PaaI family thioesterase n=1 Tax=Psychromonas aquimarina TaxID=444919 RepID=UPI0004204B4F|nr:PaaI family thioesterase [Psychromonas aquimarina]